MAWNPSPEVAVAREAAAKLKAGAAVVLWWTGDGKIGMASYGKDRRCCAATGKIGERLFNAAMNMPESQDLDALLDAGGES